MILDNHSAHISKETMVYLASRPNRFIYVHTPKHGSWLNHGAPLPTELETERNDDVAPYGLLELGQLDLAPAASVRPLVQLADGHE